MNPRRSAKRPAPCDAERILEIWRDEALWLDYAWWDLGSPEQKEQYRNAGQNQSLTAFTKSTMKRDLLDRLATGELPAIGVQVAPTLGDGPEIISSFVFHQPQVDWAKRTVSAYGRTYESVKIVRGEHARKLGTAHRRTPKAPAGGMGRPLVIDELRTVVRELAQAGELNRISRKEQENRVRARSQLHYPNLFPAPRPSRTKILEALKAEGF
jgi:hypothetical protein